MGVYKKLLNNTTTSDFVIRCRDTTFSCHKVILASRSSYFNHMFENPSITEYAVATFPMVVQYILQYLYTDNLLDIQDISHVDSIIEIATTWDIPHITQSLQKQYWGTIDVAQSSTIHHDISNFIQKNSCVYSDLTIIDQKSTKRYATHKAILCCNSMYFQCMLEGKWKESEGITELSVPHFPEALYCYMYHNPTFDIRKYSLEELINLCEACQYFVVEDLLGIIECNLERLLDVENIVDMWKLAHVFVLEELTEYIIRFGAREFKQLTESKCYSHLEVSLLHGILNTGDVSLDYETIHKALLQWGQFQLSSNKCEKSLEELLYPLLPPNVLFNARNKEFLFASHFQLLPMDGEARRS